MASVTVGEVSAMINAAIILIQLTLPLCIVLVLLGLLKNWETAATWSVAARIVQTSLWPTILDSDYAQTRGVRNRFVALSWIGTIAVLLVAVVGVTTPIGLTDTFELGEPQDVSFHYSRDPGSFGQGTAERDTYQYSRVCGGSVYMNCPGVNGGFETWVTENGTFSNFNKSTDIIDLRIPANITEVFTSATNGTTLSSVFDMQYRTYFHESTADENTIEPLQNNEPYTVGQLRTLQSLILSGNIEIVEGLIVDAKQGGVGLRNHTIPSRTQYGAEWEEDILWIEPVTECVDTNLTIEFEYAGTASSFNRTAKLFLVDNGGFVDLSPEFPFIDQNDTQKDPQLYASAYRAAAFNNALAAAFFNLTEGRKDSGKARMGARYNLARTESTSRTPTPPINEITIEGFTGSYLPFPPLSFNQSSRGDGLGPITQDNFTFVDEETRRYRPNDMANMSTVGIQVGMLMGAPHLTSGSNSLVLEPWSNWTQKMFACASATRASVKTIRFTIKNTTDLTDLSVVSVKDKTYPSDTDMPLWAIEKSNLTFSDYSPLWGIVDNRHEDSSNLHTRRKRDLWLPGGNNYKYGRLLSQTLDALPAGAHLAALASAYGVDAMDGGLTSGYSGKNDFALNVKWRDLTWSADSTPNIINLIWTDIMANFIVGTKSRLNASPSNDLRKRDTSSAPNAAKGSAQLLERRIVYDMRYAIPGIILLALWVVFIIIAIAFSFRISISGLKQFINQLAPGRLATNFLYGTRVNDGSYPVDASTREWSKTAGSLMVGFEQRDGEPAQVVSASATELTDQNIRERKGLVSSRLSVVAPEAIDGHDEILNSQRLPLSHALSRRAPVTERSATYNKPDNTAYQPVEQTRES
ncbi:hypothetical protein AJ80_09020 [Polytolypa hystricis UAMH7299]|uniref:Uncharacterized protein n=1 Tax=Polytolypa hystricis (strain UAMH7299) TaxID=1447883 RepID=A0A2B7WXL2_POLH7|nr:hypothetical protein AJ80_09020 [Polytolypa hystricis UAMH7299]